MEIEGQICNVYVLVRPGAVEFLQALAPHYELVIYTASLSKYADPLMDIMDRERLVAYRLFREHCTFFNGVFVKDLSLIGRDLKEVIIVDNSPNSYALQPENALPILSWYDDPDDRRLAEMIPLLERLASVDDVRKFIPRFVKNNEVDYVAAKRVFTRASPKAPSEKRPVEPEAPPRASHDAIPDEAGGARKVHSLELRKPLINSWTSAAERPPPSRDPSAHVSLNVSANYGSKRPSTDKRDLREPHRTPGGQLSLSAVPASNEGRAPQGMVFSLH